MMEFIQDDLKRLEEQELLRHLRLVNGAQSRVIDIDGKKRLNFCSNNYLGLADEQQIVEAAIEGLRRDGVGSGASRLVCGNMRVHEKLEQAIASLKKKESALLFNSGYAANSGVIPALMERDDIIFSDKLNHASIVDGVILSRAQFKRYPHLDMECLEQELKKASRKCRKMIITDSVFSMDGDVAPLKAIVDLAKQYEAFVYVDEAHGFGVLGEHGGGLVEELGLENDIDISMGTLSKAAGCFGAYVAGDKSLRDYLINHARSFIYTTSMPPAMAQAALAAVQLIADKNQGGIRRAQLRHNAKYLRSGLKAMGFDCMNSTTPIIPILVKDSSRALALSRQLFDQGIYVSAIRPPTVPINGARLRITVMATHTQEDLDILLRAMKEL